MTAPTDPGRRTGPRRPPIGLVATVTTCWAALVSLTPVLAVVVLVHLVDGAGAPTEQVLRVGLAGWLLAHGVPVGTGAGSIGFAPLGFSALAVWRVVRAGVHTTRAMGGRRSRSPRLAGIAASGVAAVYGLLGVVAARFASAPGLTISVPRAAGTMAVFGFVAALVGAFAESGFFAALAGRAPAVVREGLRTGVVAALLVLGAGAAVGGTAIAVAGGEAAEVLAAYHTGVAGQAGLTLLCLVYVPNLTVWAASYLVGPGFAVGAGTTVSAARVSLGDLPAIPVLAGLPSGPANAWGPLLLSLPLAAGMAAGWLLARRFRPPAVPGWFGLFGAAIIAGPVAGALLALTAVVASGSLGTGRLAVVGPAAGPFAAVGAGLVATGAGLAAAATKVLVGTRHKEPPHKDR